MPWIRTEHAKVAVVEAMRSYLRTCSVGGMPRFIQDHITSAVNQMTVLSYLDLAMVAYAVPDRDPEPPKPQHDNLHDNVGQAIKDVFDKNGLEVPGLDIHDAREIDLFTDAVIPLVNEELYQSVRKANDDAIEHCVRGYAAGCSGDPLANVMYGMTRRMTDGARAKALNALIEAGEL